MFTHTPNPSQIIQTIKIDLSQLSDKASHDFATRFPVFIANIPSQDRTMFKYNPDKSLTYKTEVLLPEGKPDRKNLLIVLGNPATHSIAEGMFFSYEKMQKPGLWREHRFWRALHDTGILKFHRELERPRSENIQDLNEYKRKSLLGCDYDSKFNIFMLPYFSFPTPASKAFNGVAGIRKALGRELFEKMLEFELKRFEDIVTKYKIKHVVCFQKGALREIEKSNLKPIKIYDMLPTRLIHTRSGKKELTKIGNLFSK